MKIFSFSQIIIWICLTIITIHYKNDMTVHENPLCTTSLIIFFLAMGLTSMSYIGIALNSCCVVNNTISEAVSTGNAIILNNVWVVLVGS